VSTAADIEYVERCAARALTNEIKDQSTAAGISPEQLNFICSVMPLLYGDVQ
jgi:hypothetical protein